MKKAGKAVVWGAIFLLFAVTLVPGSRAADDYPSKPVTVLVPYSPGGISDTMARLLADLGRKYFPQPLVVENRTGASGTKAIYDLVVSKPDGYTICLASSGEAIAALHMIPANFNPDSYTVVCQVGTQPVTVSTAGPWNTLQELIDYGKKNPGKIRGGVSGMGGITRVVGDMWAMKAGIEIKIVPFQGSGPVIPAVLGKHIEVGFLNVPEAVAHYKSGEMKVLCVFDENRSKALPNVPTAKELGYDVSGGSTHFVIVPNGTPQSALDKLDQMVRKIEADPEFPKRTVELGYSPYYKDPKAARAFVKEWYETSGKIYEILGLKKK
jgi:tripartite-type tricarboxylate transporter receptor subunit TctC